MGDVTAILMGDPAVRQVRQPTREEIERTRLGDLAPTLKRGSPHNTTLTAFGIKVRAMKVGDKLLAPSMNVAKGMAGQMNTHHGWFISCRTVPLKDGTRGAEMTRVR